MHDLSLGAPVSIGVVKAAKHSGPCYDGVYGCHECHNAANSGRGEVSSCDRCHRKNTFTQIVRAWDEPCLYELCKACELVWRLDAQLYADDDESDEPQIVELLSRYNAARRERDRIASLPDEEALAVLRR